MFLQDIFRSQIDFNFSSDCVFQFDGSSNPAPETIYQDEARKGRNLLSESSSVSTPTAEPWSDIESTTCECQTRFDFAKNLKVNYFANGFETTQDYLRAKTLRR